MILGANYGSISDIEVAWCLIALFGLGFAVWNFHDAMTDLSVLRIRETEARNGRYIVAKRAVWAEGARVMIQLIFLTIGIAAMTLDEAPDALDQPLRLTIIGVIFRWGLIVAACLTTFKSYLAFQVRHELLEYERAHMGPRGKQGIPGPAGPPGDTGRTGKTGKTGEAGADA